MAKFKQEVAEADGWSREIFPVMKGYKMACCDCGLVHDINFAVVAVTKKNKNGTWSHGAKLGGHRILMQVRRNVKSTAQIRRHMRK